MDLLLYGDFNLSRRIRVRTQQTAKKLRPVRQSSNASSPCDLLLRQLSLYLCPIGSDRKSDLAGSKTKADCLQSQGCQLQKHGRGKMRTQRALLPVSLSTKPTYQVHRHPSLETAEVSRVFSYIGSRLYRASSLAQTRDRRRRTRRY